MLTLLELNWPPPVYEMPTYVPYSASDLASVFEILKNSLKSMTNTGLLILGICLAAGSIFSIVGNFVRRALALEDGVKRNMFRREVGNLDMKRNAGSIAINREMNMHMNFLARKLYHKLHREDEIEEGIYKRELAHEVDQRIKEKHPEWAIERRMESAETDRQYREQTRQQRLDDFIRRTREKDEFEAALRQQNRERAAQRIVQSRLDSMEANEILRSEHGEKLVHDAVERSWVSDEAQAAFRAQNPDRAVQRMVQNRLDSMKANKEIMESHYGTALEDAVDRKTLNSEADMAFNYEKYEIALESRAVSGVVSHDARIRRDEIIRNRIQADRQKESHTQQESGTVDEEPLSQNVDPVTGEVIVHQIPQNQPKRRLLKGGKKK